MADFAKELVPISLEDEMRKSYLDYAMSVIVGRALPDVRDGLKPVHRRVLYAMHVLSNDWNKPYKKSARVVGDVIGKYHPHGDTAVYDTIVRMAQPFSLRYMLIDGQGNFGSVDGDSPAAMRYTEVRMSKIAHELLADLEKETVDFTANYDESEHEPSVLPAKIPNLLVNGSAGIAVGMATNIPPHNLTEVINACLALIDDPDISIEGLMEHVPGPDFPTAGTISGARGIRDAYQTGRGKIYVRARSEFEGDENKPVIVVKELPYQVNKARLLEKMAELVRDKRLEGISGLRDESDKDGMRMVIELKRGELPDVVLNNLYKHTQMQVVFGINTVALVDGQPRTLNLKELLDAFLRHRREVVTRRTIFDLKKARERAHVLEGLTVALTNIDEVIELIKAAPSPADAKAGLLAKPWASGQIKDMLQRAGAESSRPATLEAEYGLHEDGYHLSPAQAQAILELRLHRLTGLEQDKIISEYTEILERIADLLEILENPERLLQVIRDELAAVQDQFGDERRTVIVEVHDDLTDEDLIPDEPMVVTLSHGGYIKSQQLGDYQAQRRGGKGKSATKTKEEDFVDQMFVASSHDTLLCFTNFGKLYWLKVYRLPQAGRAARGRPIVNLLPFAEGERITTTLPVREYPEDKYIFMATRNGTVKKVSLDKFSRPLKSGIIAVDLRGDNELVGVEITNGEQDVLLFASNGKAMRFNESAVRGMGRTAAGVRGIRLADDESVVGLVVDHGDDILTVTANGYGKRTKMEEFPQKGRGGMGVIGIQTSERNGALVGAIPVAEADEVMLISDGGTLVRTEVVGISLLGRNTQGVRLIRVSENEQLIGVERVIAEDDEEPEEGVVEGAGIDADAGETKADVSSGDAATHDGSADRNSDSNEAIEGDDED